MDFISLNFYLFLLVCMAFYYAFPIKYRYYVLLVGSMVFYYFVSGHALIILGIMIIFSYSIAIMMERYRKSVKILRMLLIVGIIITVSPLVLVKCGTGFAGRTLLAPVGLSFFTLQMIAYLVDVYKGKVSAQKNIFKYALFASFFPQIIQGPIPRYEQLGKQLFEGHRFDEKNIISGFQVIIWGFFLKLMIADKAGVIVDTIFGKSDMYLGMYALIGGCLYSVQLYADFLACTTLSRGIAQLFGVQLENNFNHPFFSTSIKEFWGRWHISLSSWLRDYIYIPLGGNRKGKIRKYVNLFITFVVSGIWHGNGYKFIFWGCIHAIYQMVGELTYSAREKIYTFLGFSKDSSAKRLFRQIFTFGFVMLAWIIFRADRLREGIKMVSSIFTVYNPWIVFDDSLLELGLSWKECMLLIASIFVLCKVSILQQKISVRNKIMEQPVVIRFGIYIVAIIVIFVFGTYGFGFDAQDFIYGGF